MAAPVQEVGNGVVWAIAAEAVMSNAEYRKSLLLTRIVTEIKKSR